MKLKNIKLIIACSIGLAFSSCTKWLNVQPEDRFSEEQVFSTAQGFEETLNGVYIKLSSNNLYGDNLTLTIPDILAQLYMTNSAATHALAALGRYEYGETKVVKPRIKAIWGDAYVAIANINKLIEAIDTKGGAVLQHDRLHTMKGELLGLRAFLHFDMLRLYGPVYDSADSTLHAIPYYRATNVEVQPLSPANKVIDMVLMDLNEALSLMKDDPVKSLGYKEQNNHRFNYYAVLGTKARALLYRKDKVGAHQAAKEVVEQSDLFPWIKGAKITADTKNPDRIFHTELLFAAYSNDLYNNYNEYFYYEQGDNILAGGPHKFINRVFEEKTADYRYTYLWKTPPAIVGHEVFFKYSDIADKRVGVEQQRNLIPLIRLSEMYYILAETDPTPATGLAYLNKVLNARGLTALTTTTNLDNEILKEYRKEFYGEGQLWYYYKRKKIETVLSSLTTGNSNIPNTAWVVPIPEEELANR
ncbi:RagB/SusD family nutrient uptake outer membrane protein [Sphingobacterium tabacisoli]|uniref:RagB/SusD family nutrient uptake outer membrane protein n=1 Tax=Sphingobacterium tabacisoli TaxID=2044855 RepID=A0ABW5KXN7_9SPHI|nr:RagB/SusD family nutrient uptake outer membrane protein [Sphingobacterium tabacisoli]